MSKFEGIWLEFQGVGLVVVDKKSRHATALQLDVERTGGRRHRPMLLIEDSAELSGDEPDFVVMPPGADRPVGAWLLEGATLILDHRGHKPSLKVDASAVPKLISKKDIGKPSSWSSLRRMPDIRQAADLDDSIVHSNRANAAVVMNSGQLQALMPVTDRRAVRFEDGGSTVLGPTHLTGQCVWTLQPHQTHVLTIRRQYSERRISVGPTARMAVSNQCLTARPEAGRHDLERVYHMVNARRRPRPLREDGPGHSEYPDNVNCGNFVLWV